MSIALLNRGREWIKSITHESDLKSINSFLNHHLNLMNQNKTQKYYKTTDISTISLVEKLTKNNQSIKKAISYQPSLLDKEYKSLKVSVCDIGNHPQYFQQYQNWKKIRKSRIIAAGGPSAVDQTLLSCLIPQIKQNTDINYYCRDYNESNYVHSGLQNHARHAFALSYINNNWGIFMLPKVIMKKIKSIDFKIISTFQMSVIDFNLWNYKYWPVYIRYDLYAYKEKLSQLMGYMNNIDLCKIQGTTCQQIQEYIQKQTNLHIAQVKNWTGKYQTRTIEFFKETPQQDKKNHQRDKDLMERGYKTKWRYLTLQEIKQQFPRSYGLKAAAQIYEEYNNPLSLQEDVKNYCQKQNASWNQGLTIEKVFVTKKDEKLFAAGVLLSNQEFVPADKIHLSLGYKADFIFENTSISPLETDYVPSTGASMNVIIKITPDIKEKLEKFGTFPMLSGKYTHWTEICHDEEHLLLRVTAGGNTGSEQYMPEYALNCAALTKSIFGESFIGIYSCYGCCRSVNYRNITQIAKVADGLLISYGKGGTGNTKRATQAYSVLKQFGYSEELRNYFNKMQNRRMNIAENMDLISQKKKQFGTFYSSQKKAIKVLFK